MISLQPYPGMSDIARQTVEFLYEENGGVPRDLHLPTLEDIKVCLFRFFLSQNYFNLYENKFCGNTFNPGLTLFLK